MPMFTWGFLSPYNSPSSTASTSSTESASPRSNVSDTPSANSSLSSTSLTSQGSTAFPSWPVRQSLSSPSEEESFLSWNQQEGSSYISASDLDFDDNELDESLFLPQVPPPSPVSCASSPGTDIPIIMQGVRRNPAFGGNLAEFGLPGMARPSARPSRRRDGSRTSNGKKSRRTSSENKNAICGMSPIAEGKE
jgi:hypothetical protein